MVLQQTTHLIAERAEGEKYIQAKKCPHIEIVTPKWLEECAAKNMLMSTHEFRLDFDPGDANSGEFMKIGVSCPAANTNLTNSPHSAAISTMAIAIRALLSDRVVPPNPLFTDCSFYLVGFLRDEFNLNKCDESSLQIRDQSSVQLKKDFCRLIRRCMGTIYWDVHEAITHVVVNEESDMKTRYVCE